MQLTCPHCRSVLEADVNRGVALDCPVCTREFFAGAATQRTRTGRGSVPLPSASARFVEPIVAAPVREARLGDDWQCRVCGTQNPAPADRCEFCDADQTRRGRTPLLRADVPVPSKLRVGEVLSTTMRIFARHTGLLVVVTLVELLLLLLFVIPMAVLFVIVAFAARNAANPAIELFVIVTAVLLILGAWIVYQAQHPGHYAFMLKLARGQKATLSDLFGHARASSKQVALSFVVTGLIALGLIAFIIPGLIVITLSWPYGRLVVDRDPPGWTAITESIDLVRPHFGAVVSLGAIVIGFQYLLSVLPFAFLFSIPYGSLALTVAYLRMQGEPTIADIERARRR